MLCIMEPKYYQAGCNAKIQHLYYGDPILNVGQIAGYPDRLLLVTVTACLDRSFKYPLTILLKILACLPLLTIFQSNTSYYFCIWIQIYFDYRSALILKVNMYNLEVRRELNFFRCEVYFFLRRTGWDRFQ